jgi:collagen type I alpha
MHSPIRQLQLLCVLAILPMAAIAQTVPISQDSYVVTSPATANNYGTAATINVGGTAVDQGLVQFDLSTLPTGTTAGNIAKATLALFVNKLGASGTINVSVANGPWTELGVNGTNAPAAAAAVATGVSVSTVSDYIYVDATAAVQSWLNGTTNSGFIITPNTGTGVNVAFDSKESTTTSHPATLTITLASSGATGATGPTGSNGSAGATGATGANGTAGTTGATGATGANGTAGTTGATGATGANGTAGATGATGATGANGTAGATGATGATGANGTAGATGATGANGTAGATGPTGANGSAGATGPAGAAGATGPQGPQGAQGATGATGTSTGTVYTVGASESSPQGTGTISGSSVVYFVSNGATITLPTGTAGQHVILINVAGPTNGSATANVDAPSGGLIENGPLTTATSSSNFADAMELVADGNKNWWVVYRQ